MLTKQDREKIAERVLSFNEDYLCYADIYECLFGERPRYSALSEEYDKAIRDQLIDLCDTSNMIELPLDKDGEVIRVGDTVYIGDGIKYEVAGYMMRGNSTEVILAAGAEPVYTKEPANNITHKKPVTIRSLVERIKNVMNDDSTTVWAYDELDDIADQLEKLGDSDEAIAHYKRLAEEGR